MGNKVAGNGVQLGDSGTATQNFTLTAVAADGTMKLARGNAGATTQDVLTVDGSGNVNAPVAMQQGGVAMPRMVLETAKATTSGTLHDFTGIPSWVKRITVMFNAVSTGGTGNYLIQLGSGSIEAAGYNSSAATAGASITSVSATNGFILTQVVGTGEVFSGLATISLLGSNIYTISGSAQRGSSVGLNLFAGSKTLSGALDRLRLTTTTGDTFDAGSVNILYEG